MKEIKLIDCECDGVTCCGAQGIAVFSVERNGIKLKVCTRCDLSSDSNKKILPYVKNIPAEKLIKFDPLGAICLSFFESKRSRPSKPSKQRG